MARQSFFHRLRDGAFFTAAVAIVLYVVLADHRLVRSDEEIASASEAIVVGNGSISDRPVPDRLAAVGTAGAR